VAGTTVDSSIPQHTALPTAASMHQAPRMRILQEEMVVGVQVVMAERILVKSLIPRNLTTLVSLLRALQELAVMRMIMRRKRGRLYCILSTIWHV